MCVSMTALSPNINAADNGVDGWEQPTPRLELQAPFARRHRTGSEASTADPGPRSIRPLSNTFFCAPQASIFPKVGLDSTNAALFLTLQEDPQCRRVMMPLQSRIHDVVTRFVHHLGAHRWSG